MLAQLAVLLAATSYAFAGIYGRRFKRMGIEPLVTATGQVTASTLLLFPIAMIVDPPWTLATPPLEVWLAALGSAVFSTAIGYVLYFRILATAGATNLLLVTFLIPISAIIMGTVGLGEHLAPRHFLGLAFIGVGLAAIDGRWMSWRSKEASYARATRRLVPLRARRPNFTRRSVGVIHHEIVRARPRTEQVRDVERTVVAARPRNELNDLGTHEKLSQSTTRINSVSASAMR